MKKEIIFGLLGIVFFSGIVWTHVRTWEQGSQLLTDAASSVQVAVPAVTAATVGASTSSDIILTTAVVADHNQPGDCWLIVQGKVYNVTGYLGYHPGGPEQIIPYCGKDATQAFVAQHNTRAYRDLSQLYVGDLGSGVVAAAVGQASTTAAVPAASVRPTDNYPSRYEREREDD